MSEEKLSGVMVPVQFDKAHNSVHPNVKGRNQTSGFQVVFSVRDGTVVSTGDQLGVL